MPVSRRKIEKAKGMFSEIEDYREARNELEYGLLIRRIDRTQELEEELLTIRFRIALLDGKIQRLTDEECQEAIAERME